MAPHDIFLSSQFSADQQHIHKNNTSFMKKTIAAIVMGTVLAVGSTNAAIVFGNLGASGTSLLAESGNGVTASTWWATGFTAASPNIYLNSATIGLIGTGTIELSLYSDSPGNPGSLLVSDSQAVSFGQATTASFSFLNPTSTPLVSGISYWIVARALSGSATWATELNEVLPGAQNGSGWTATGGRVSTSSGSSWTSSVAATRGSISIDATAAPIPEPGTWAAMAIFAGGAAYAGWRRRQQPQMA